jgi:VanZ family protein
MKNKWFRWVLVLLWFSLIYYFSESPTFTGENTAKVINHIVEVQPPEVTIDHHHGFSFSWNFVVRKLAHLSIFGMLAFLAWKAMYPRRFAWFGAWGIAVLCAIFDEWHQSFQPGRTALVSDVVIDACGAALALLLVRIYLRMKRS